MLNALPFHAAVSVATVAARLGVHYFDLTEDVAATQAIRQLSQNARSVLMPQCGLAPGFIGVVGHDLAQRFLRGGGELLDLQMRVGALPRYPSNALKYNLTWSTEGLINEYCNPCEAIVDGRRVELPALEGLETFALDGIEYEAFNTSGGLGTLPETLAGRAHNVDYKSIRYPGHCALMKLLLNDLRLRERRGWLREIFDRAIPVTEQDVVIVFATATGYPAGGERGRGPLTQASFSARIGAWTARPGTSTPSSSPRPRASARPWTWWQAARCRSRASCGRKRRRSPCSLPTASAAATRSIRCRRPPYESARDRRLLAVDGTAAAMERRHAGGHGHRALPGGWRGVRPRPGVHAGRGRQADRPRARGAEQLGAVAHLFR